MRFPRDAHSACARRRRVRRPTVTIESRRAGLIVCALGWALPTVSPCSIRLKRRSSSVERGAAGLRVFFQPAGRRDERGDVRSGTRVASLKTHGSASLKNAEQARPRARDRSGVTCWSSRMSRSRGMLVAAGMFGTVFARSRRRSGFARTLTMMSLSRRPYVHAGSDANFISLGDRARAFLVCVAWRSRLGFLRSRWQHPQRDS